ncbi:NB-ARC domain-containing protein [Streptomyces puniciscabiei]|uniref:NB-ARC domain-containing protein n=1 Tax=Streptomyces puniciscabiei TaxID=164348 RepID=UPI00332E5348
MGSPHSNPVQQFHAQLRALYEAAGQPSYRGLERRTETLSSNLQAWVTGGSVPSPGKSAQFKALTDLLERLAARNGNKVNRGTGPSWEELRQRAWHYKQVAKLPQRQRLRLTVGHVPANVDCYEHRPRLRSLLETSAPGGTTVLGQVITGMGGVGKTQLAAHYARTAYAEGAVDVVVWVTASSRSAVIDAFTDAAARLLGLRHDDPRAAAAFLNWLALAPGTKDSGAAPGAQWLIVLDDVPHLEALRDLWPPDVPHGQTLITTRNRDAAFMASHRRRIEIGCFTPEEASAYLNATLGTHDRQEDPVQVAGLAEDFGRLPLALSQAVPYMMNRHLDCGTYRTLLADRARTLSDVLPSATGLPDQQSKTVAAAWDLSIELANRQRPTGLARPLLQLLSLLDPNGIPSPVLTAEPLLAALHDHHTDRPAPATRPTQDSIRDALWNLHQFSLIDHTPENPCHAVRVHQLIQRAVHERLPIGLKRNWIITAADALRAAWPDVERHLDLATTLRANVSILYDRFPETLRHPEVHDLLYRAGQSLGETGQVCGT